MATVSYVLSGRAGQSAGVRPETADRVRAAAEKLGYEALRPRERRRRRTGTAIIAVTVLRDPWTQNMISTVSEVLRADGLEVLVQLDGDWQQTLRRQGADAVFLDEVDESRAGRSALTRLANRGERLIVWSRSLPAHGYDVIDVRDVEGVAATTRYLLDRYETVGFVAGEGGSPYRDRRLLAYEEALRAAGQVVRPEWVERCRPDVADAYRTARRLLQRPDRPRALLGFTDFAALAVLQAAADLGLTVPGDVAVVGAGNTAAGKAQRTPLTSVGADDIFTAVAELLRDRARATAYTPGRHTFPWTVHRPGSTA